MTSIRASVACLLAVFACASAQAVTFFVPPDRELIQKADDIVIATGVTSVVERNARGSIVTRTTLRIEDVLKGPRRAGQHLVLVERGGILDGRATYIPGTPEYAPGERYLVFTSTNRDLDAVTLGMSLGRFTFEGSLLVRADVHGFDPNLEAHVERARDAKRFLDYIRGIVAQRVDPEPAYFVDGSRLSVDGWRVQSNFTRGSYLMSQGGTTYFRWQTPIATFVRSGVQPIVDGPASVTKALSQWNSTESNIDYTDAGQNDAALGGLAENDGRNAILFNDPGNEIDDASLVAGIGGITDATGPYTLDGESFFAMIEVDVVMANRTFAQNCFDSVMTHEVGHTLGFRHSNQTNDGLGVCGAPLDCTTTAIMNAAVNCTHNGVLRGYDRNAAQTVYGDGVTNPPCTPPSITAQPQNRAITTGKAASLSVTAAGTAPLVYQWFAGVVGETSRPVENGNDRNVSVSPAVTTPYWVRVTGQCGDPVRSNGVIVTVTLCPDVTIQSATASAVLDGNATLNVTASSSGQSLTYMWFRGDTPGIGGTLVGSTRQLVVAVTERVSYWARVTNACDNTAVSSVVTVTPEGWRPPRRRAVGHR